MWVWKESIRSVIKLPRDWASLPQFWALFGLLLGLGRLPASGQVVPAVAIHDSELTRALESRVASPPTPSGSGTTGFEWWPKDWHYFVMPESLKEAMKS